MSRESRHVSVVIGADPGAVYAFASDPANLPRWATGLGGSIEQVDGRWLVADGPLGAVRVTFAPVNDWGVLDHEVTLPSGQSVHNPVRVARHPDGAEVVFSVRRDPDVTDDDFELDAATVAADLDRLRALIEG